MLGIVGVSALFTDPDFHQDDKWLATFSSLWVVGLGVELFVAWSDMMPGS